MHYYFYILIFFPTSVLPNVANEEAGIAQVAPAPQDRRLYIPSEGCGDEHFLILRVELSILMGEKSLHLVGLEPATFRLQASTLTNRLALLVHPIGTST